MNVPNGLTEQKPPGAIEWTRIRNRDGSVRRGFTWNAVGGCVHDCRWAMPDGTVAECYAKTLAESPRMKDAAYKNGFAAHYWRPHILNAPKKLAEGAGIFPDSMSDLMGFKVPEDHRRQVFDVMRDTPQHIYQLLTKNAPGYLKQIGIIPKNVWCGVSSPPDWMYGKPLTMQQKESYLHRAFQILAELRSAGYTVWMSIEPLSFEGFVDILEQHKGVLSWAVIGAASEGRRYIPPREGLLKGTVAELKRFGVPCFYKGNLRSSSWAQTHWYEEFPQ